MNHNNTTCRMRSKEVFKEVVLRVWRASNSPDAVPNKLLHVESIEVMYQREMRIRNMVGLAPPGGLGTNLLLNNGTTNIRNSHFSLIHYFNAFYV